MAARDAPIAAAMAALTGSAPAVSALEALTSQEREKKKERRQLQILVKKEKRRLKNLSKRLNKLDANEVLMFLQARLSSPQASGSTTSAATAPHQG